MKKKILCLAMTVIMAAGVHTTAFAKDYQGANGWQVNFTGGKMESNFKSSDVTDELANIQPGDSIELKVQLKNSDSTDTDWYMTNEVIQTLEDAQSSAEGGAYEYKLTYVGSDNAEKVLYDSTTVGGEGVSKAGEGLKQIDSSTQEYFYLGRLASNNTGTVHLTVGVEGETQGNGYQLTLAKLRMNFAVEKVSAGKTITKNKIVKTTNTVKTGRTGRAGREGRAFSFVSGKEVYKLKEIQRYCKTKIYAQKVPSLNDVANTKMENILDDVERVIEQEDLDMMINAIEERVNNSEFTAMDMAAAFLKICCGMTEDNKNTEESDWEFGDTGAGEDGMVRLFSNIGKKQRVRPGDILGAIAGESGMDGKLIGTIDMYDKYTFVEVPREYAREVLNAMKNVKIKGKTVAVEPANQK